MSSSPRHHAYQARSVWPPEPGYFALRRTRNGWRVPAQITHDEQGWCAIIDGLPGTPHPDPTKAADVSIVWTGGIRIPQVEYDYLLGVKAWALANDPEHPALHPFKPIRPSQLRPLAPR